MLAVVGRVSEPDHVWVVEDRNDPAEPRCPNGSGACICICGMDDADEYDGPDAYDDMGGS